MKIAAGILFGLLIGGALLVFNNSGGSAPKALDLGGSDERAQLDERLEQRLEELEQNSVVLGAADAPLTLIEFGDYQCTFCTRFFNDTKPILEEKYVSQGLLKMVFVDYAINGHESVNAAEASQCAADQGAYWDYHNKLFEERMGYNVGAFTKENLVRFARDLGLDESEFAQCYNSEKYKDKVRESTREAPMFGARGTPTFLLNGQLIPGAQPLTFFETAIQQELAFTSQSTEQ